jgi:hypothetical protein
LSPAPDLHHFEIRHMKTLGKDLKRAFSGLAYQNSGGNLSTREKMKALNGKSKNANKESTVKPADTVQTNKSDQAA